MHLVDKSLFCNAFSDAREIVTENATVNVNEGQKSDVQLQTGNRPHLKEMHNSVYLCRYVA